VEKKAVPAEGFALGFAGAELSMLGVISEEMGVVEISGFAMGVTAGDCTTFDVGVLVDADSPVERRIPP
jgi:hypothetical protein